MKKGFVGFYVFLILVTLVSKCVCTEEDARDWSMAPAPRAMAQFKDVDAYRKSISMRDGQPLLLAGTMVYLLPHPVGVLDIRCVGFQPQSFVDFIEQKVEQSSSSLRQELSRMSDEATVRERLVTGYADFIQPIIQRHCEVVALLNKHGVQAKQEGRMFSADMTPLALLSETDENIDVFQTGVAFCAGHFPNPRVHLDSSNALLREARIITLETPCTIFSLIRAH